MKRPLRWSILLILAVMPLAHAEVRQASADSFLIAQSVPVTATPAKAYAALAEVQRWWSDEHTWSGNAANLSLKAEAGGCFCERWPGGSAEHGHVIMALPDKLLRIDTALGPLQEFALKGILSFWIRSDEEGATQVALEYRVNGSALSGLDAFAPQVDAVLSTQLGRLARFIDTGDPHSAAAATAVAPQRTATIDPGILAEWAAQAAAASAPPADAAKGNPRVAPAPPKKKPGSTTAKPVADEAKPKDGS